MADDVLPTRAPATGTAAVAIDGKRVRQEEALERLEELLRGLIPTEGRVGEAIVTGAIEALGRTGLFHVAGRLFQSYPEAKAFLEQGDGTPDLALSEDEEEAEDFRQPPGVIDVSIEASKLLRKLAADKRVSLKGRKEAPDPRTGVRYPTSDAEDISQDYFLKDRTLAENKIERLPLHPTIKEFFKDREEGRGAEADWIDVSVNEEELNRAIEEMRRPAGATGAQTMQAAALAATAAVTKKTRNRGGRRPRFKPDEDEAAAKFWREHKRLHPGMTNTDRAKQIEGDRPEWTGLMTRTDGCLKPNFKKALEALDRDGGDN